MVKMNELQWYLDNYGDTTDTKLTYYKTYLIQTDYIIAKISEANYLGLEISVEDKTKYSEIFQQRAYAREQINLLEVQ